MSRGVYVVLKSGYRGMRERYRGFVEEHRGYQGFTGRV